jgi:hypothetical protein
MTGGNRRLPNCRGFVAARLDRIERDCKSLEDAAAIRNRKARGVASPRNDQKRLNRPVQASSDDG